MSLLLALAGCLVPAPDAAIAAGGGDNLRAATPVHTVDELADAPAWTGHLTGPCDGPVPIQLSVPGSATVLVAVTTNARDYTIPLPEGTRFVLRYGCDANGDGLVPRAEVQEVVVRAREKQEIDLPLPLPEGAGLDLRTVDRVAGAFARPDGLTAAAPPPPPPGGAPPLPAGSPGAPPPPGTPPDGALGPPGTPGAPGVPAPPAGAPGAPPPGTSAGGALAPADGALGPPSGAAGPPSGAAPPTGAAPPSAPPG